MSWKSELQSQLKIIEENYYTRARWGGAKPTQTLYQVVNISKVHGLMSITMLNVFWNKHVYMIAKPSWLPNRVHQKLRYFLSFPIYKQNDIHAR